MDEGVVIGKAVAPRISLAAVTAKRRIEGPYNRITPFGAFCDGPLADGETGVVKQRRQSAVRQILPIDPLTSGIDQGGHPRTADAIDSTLDIRLGDL